MTTRDFFRMIIKLFGLYLLLQTTFHYIPSSVFSQFYGLDIYGLIIVFVLFLLVYGISLVIIEKVDWIIDKLKLDQGFDEDRINLGNLNEYKITSFVVVIIGGFLLVDYFPSFLNNLYLSFRETANTSGLNDLFYSQKVEYFDWAISCMNLILGYLLIMNNRYVSKWIVEKSKVSN